jgi:PIN domain nuclease of toxin-antitoxin system
VEKLAVILLDTHVLLWLAAEPSRLSRTATAAIRRALRSGGIAIASISLWEIAVQGRLRARGTTEPYEILAPLGAGWLTYANINI